VISRCGDADGEKREAQSSRVRPSKIQTSREDVGPLRIAGLRAFRLEQRSAN
jgi:hypothetical protein